MIRFAILWLIFALAFDAFGFGYALRAHANSTMVTCGASALLVAALLVCMVWDEVQP